MRFDNITAVYEQGPGKRMNKGIAGSRSCNLLHIYSICAKSAGYEIIAHKKEVLLSGIFCVDTLVARVGFC